jgi:hypothetical protein
MIMRVVFFLLLLLSMAVAATAEPVGDGAADPEVVALFQSLEQAFRRKSVQDIIANLHQDFIYDMTYRTDGALSALKNDLQQYRESLGAFFLSNPDIVDYRIMVESADASGREVTVQARIISVVRLNGIVNSCDASSGYSLLRANGRLLIKGVRGEAACTNTKGE